MSTLVYAHIACGRARIPIGPKGQRRPAEVIGNAIKVARIATGEEEEEFVAKPEKKEAAAELGRKGGAARAKSMTPEKRAGGLLKPRAVERTSF